MREQVQGSVWDKVFKISERGSSVSRELFAGATTFLCVSYVLAVNPAILGAAGALAVFVQIIHRAEHRRLGHREVIVGVQQLCDVLVQLFGKT